MPRKSNRAQIKIEQLPSGKVLVTFNFAGKRSCQLLNTWSEVAIRVREELQNALKHEI